MAVYERIHNRRWKIKTFQGAPPAFVKNIPLVNSRRGIQVHHYEVGKISFADITSVSDTKTAGYRMTHFINHHLERHFPGTYIIQHQRHCMLNQRQACMRLFIRLAFLCPCVRGMICRDQVQPAVKQCSPQCFPVVGRFNRRIALDLIAKPRIIITGKMEMMNTYFCGDPFFFLRNKILKKAAFLFQLSDETHAGDYYISLQTGWP